jgi:hypothetical protein
MSFFDSSRLISSFQSRAGRVVAHGCQALDTRLLYLSRRALTLIQSIHPIQLPSIFLSTQHQLICLFVQLLLHIHTHHHVRATDHSIKEGEQSLCPGLFGANLANASLQAVEALENFNIESPMKQPLFTALSEEKENIITKEVAVPVKGIPMPEDLPEVEEAKPSAAPGIKGDEMNEPILQVNPNRFVLFPIKYHEVSSARLTRTRRVKFHINPC